jgi:hypothetical protein
MVIAKCGCEFSTNQSLVDKVRELAAQDKQMSNPALIDCECGKQIEMTTLVYKCPHCKMTYAVTPCSADDHNFIVKAGIDY